MMFHHLSAEFSKQIQAADNCADRYVDQRAAKCASQCAVAYEAVTAQLAMLTAFEAEMQNTADTLIIKVSATFKLVVNLKSSVSNIQACIVNKQELHALIARLTKQQSILLSYNTIIIFTILYCIAIYENNTYHHNTIYNL